MASNFGSIRELSLVDSGGSASSSCGYVLSKGRSVGRGIRFGMRTSSTAGFNGGHPTEPLGQLSA
jgi:hypothetical protein